MIHKYKQEDLNIVLDVNSGAVHVVEDIVYDILDFYPSNKDEIKKNLLNKYSENNIDEAITDIDSLILAGQLFSLDTHKNNVYFQAAKPVVKSLCLHVAHDCNLRCEYCFASQGNFQGKSELMDFETGKKALDFVAKNSGNRVNLEVDFFGGEPLMNFDVVKQLVEYARSIEKEYNKNFRFTLTTNGVLLNDEINDYLNANMDNVVLSIDGNKLTNDRMRKTISGNGSYDIIMPKFKELVSKRGNKSYYVRGTFTKFNLDFAKDVIHLADLGFKSTSVEPVVSEPGLAYTITESDMDIVNKEYEKLAKEMVLRMGKENEFDFFHFNVDLTQGPCVIKRLSGCGAGSEYLAITPTGDIYPCHQFVGNEKFKMGNIHEESFDQSINKEFKNAHVYNKEKCTNCWARFYCSGGCHANAYNFNNDINIPYEIGCMMERKRLESAIYLQAKKMLKED
jgi:uncharacterized protein